jgi:EAL domain-containing protein (putative c-di-GMP-specific phosphodiesterase class I)
LPLDPRRLLGLAFAAADLLVEVDDAGDVAFAVGATKAMLDADGSALRGRGCIGLFHGADRPMIASMLASLAPGERRGPITVRLAGEPARAAIVRAFRLPGGLGASLALSPAPMPPQIGVDGLHSIVSFEAAARGLIEAARVSGADLELAMVEVGGIAAARAGLDPIEAAALDAKVASVLRLQSIDGVGAARLGDERFALLRNRGLTPTYLAKRLASALAGSAAAEIHVEAQAVAIDPDGEMGRALRAIRSALEDFAEEGFSEVAPATLAEAMNRSVRRTLARAGELGVAISQRRFQLAFQPVVDLNTGKAHHHEVLVRFESGEESPFALIQMAEQFDLIEELDHAIVYQTVKRLKTAKDKDLKLAANISGRTITSEAFVEHVTSLLKDIPSARGRLIFEVTESAAIDDLPRANRHIQALRQLGSLVCLDDFGAGATSLQYLQQLTLDIVKIDGRYVRDLAAGGRDAAMVRHIVHLCRDLKVRTVAEMVETADIEEIVRQVGVDFAQGYYYGRPSDRPEPAAERKPVALAARRGGSVESWG